MGQVCGCIKVEESTVALTQRFGKHDRVLQAGRHWVPCCLGYEVAGALLLRIEQLEVHCNTKTKDNFYVTVVAFIHYGVKEEQAADAFYKLTDAKEFLLDCVLDVLNAKIPALTLETLFEKKIQIAEEVEEELGRAMSTNGFKISKAYIVDAIVKNAIAEKNAVVY